MAINIEFVMIVGDSSVCSAQQVHVASPLVALTHRPENVKPQVNQTDESGNFCFEIEGPRLIKHGFSDAIAKVGLTKFLSDLFWVGMFYHLYNKLATNTLERVAPLTHAVGNVLKRVFVIGFSILVFGNKISTQTAIGTCIAIAGGAIYPFIKAKMEEEKRASPILKYTH
ncbi:hypothetical protein F0562_035087 [Nyssa sinensis]|uniref:Sugar phosphate transporter domain-containing protein n=1 Tax=Nyssa sinensis TaxID=561372 RepID=A0A5J5ACN2_9ASTE|nr:hypothetical protein F0562_035087 [Nyssa sinensis]